MIVRLLVRFGLAMVAGAALGALLAGRAGALVLGAVGGLCALLSGDEE